MMWSVYQSNMRLLCRIINNDCTFLHIPLYMIWRQIPGKHGQRNGQEYPIWNLTMTIGKWRRVFSEEWQLIIAIEFWFEATNLAQPFSEDYSFWLRTRVSSSQFRVFIPWRLHGTLAGLINKSEPIHWQPQSIHKCSQLSCLSKGAIESSRNKTLNCDGFAPRQNLRTCANTWGFHDFAPGLMSLLKND